MRSSAELVAVGSESGDGDAADTVVTKEGGRTFDGGERDEGGRGDGEEGDLLAAGSAEEKGRGGRQS